MEFLAQVLKDRMGLPTKSPEFRVYRLPGAHENYCYQEESTRARVVCKFYGARKRFASNPSQGALVAQLEYDNLTILRGYGLVGYPHHVVEPFGFRCDLNAALALEYFPGEEFTDAIRQCIHHGNALHLQNRLGALARFLSHLHLKTAIPCEVDFGVDCAYFAEVVTTLLAHGHVGQWDVDELFFLRDLWRSRPRMWHACQVWVHGDATPGNFLFGTGPHVVAIDLESMRHGDPAFDLGHVVAEIQHAFMLASGRRSPAEPFITYFFREYCSRFPDRESVFATVTARTPFYMALSLLRIRDNPYITEKYGPRLIDQAKTLLRIY